MWEMTGRALPSDPWYRQALPPRASDRTRAEPDDTAWESSSRFLQTFLSFSVASYLLGDRCAIIA
jgi:hypothetical protein